MIRIINGTFGWRNGSKIIPLNKDSGDVELPKELERRLVEEAKIAEYVEKPKAAPKEKAPEAFELGDRNVEDLDYKELQTAYKFYGLGSPVSVKKNDLIDAIKAHLGIDEGIESDSVGENNPDNLIPDKTKTEEDNGADETSEDAEDESEEGAEGESDDEDAPNLNGVDGVAG